MSAVHEESDRAVDVLRAGPYWLVSALAGRPVVDSDERRAWVDALAGLEGPAAALLVERDASGRPRPVGGDDRSVATGLTDIAAVMTTLDASVAADYRRSLLTFGMAVARARGPFGRSISAEDGQTLLLCASLLEPTSGGRSAPLAA